MCITFQELALFLSSCYKYADFFSLFYISDNCHDQTQGLLNTMLVLYPLDHPSGLVASVLALHSEGSEFDLRYCHYYK
jgi:hypothetical protein